MFQIVLCLMYNLSWKFHEHPFIRFFHNSTNNYGFTKKKNQSWIQGVNHHDTKMFQIVLCLVYNYSWKFLENPSIRFSIIVLTTTDSQNRKIDPKFKGLITTTRKCFRLPLSHVQSFLKISWKPVHPFPVMLLTVTDFLEKRRYNKPV